MWIPDHIVDQVRESSDILGVVQDYVRMKKAGNNYVGLCPFHEEKTPSFNVNPSKGIFKCFGCGKGGNVMTFVMEIERLEFVDAVRWLADRAGIKIPEQRVDREAFEKTEVVYHALRFASEYFTQKLQDSVSGTEALAYLRGRGLTENTIERFQLGYAPDSWDGLLKAAERGHIKPEALERAGLVIKKDNGGYYDRFRNRVIFPVWSHIGKITGFGGRALKEGPRTPKYLNSPETEVYHKSFVLYGLYQAKREARQQSKVLLVEGYTDVLALDQAGIGSVACCGTALTPQQVKLLGRFVKEIQLLYDADTAGAEATERAIDCILQNGLDASVVSLPEGEDPDSFVRKQGADKFKAYLQDETRDWLESFFWSAKQKNTLSTPQGMRKEISRVAERITWLQDQLLQKLYIQKTSQLFGVLEGDVAQEVAAHFRSRQTSANTAPAQPESSETVDTIPEPERKLLELMLEEGAPMIEYILGNMSLEEFQKGPSLELVEALVALYHGHTRESDKLGSIDVGQLQISALGRQLAASLLIRQHEISKKWEEKKIAVPKLNQNPKRIAKDCMRRVKRKLIKGEMKDLMSGITSADEGSEAQLELQEEYRKKSQYLISLEKGEVFED
ncbi:MAG: DNA primase [Rhodothermaceae bacterium]|nr:DNA primase [Rhodothermaceae bacterium]MYG69426.1 DNA primase [Rhodothermaceae bacterium]MYJ44602.1 DNA primase [Rhodothermaceae bacterium]